MARKLQELELRVLRDHAAYIVKLEETLAAKRAQFIQIQLICIGDDDGVVDLEKGEIVDAPGSD